MNKRGPRRPPAPAALHIERCSEGTPLHGLELGHLTLALGEARVTSKGRRPDQAMMLLPSLVHLLDGLRRLVQDARRGGFEFTAIDSSFGIGFTKERGEQVVQVRADRKAVGVAGASQLLHAVVAAIHAFLAVQGDAVDRSDPSSEAAFADLEAALRA